jgi:hypothetical protein
MERAALNRALALTGFLASGTVLCMVAGIFVTGFSQEFFQLSPSVDAIAAQLTGQPVHDFGLRLNIGLDNFFIIVYCAFFVVLAARLRGLMHPAIIGAGLGALLLTGLLDAIENHHIIAMLHGFEHGMPLSTDESRYQMVESNLKFHAAYLGSFLFAFGFYRLGGLGRLIAWLLWLGFVPLGVIASAVPVETATPFALARTAFFVLAFALGGVLFSRDKTEDTRVETWPDEEKDGAARA